MANLKGCELVQITHHLQIPIEDMDNVNILNYFQDAIEFISDKLKTTNVLVHCMAGISRSTTIVIAFLMANQKMTYEQAHAYVLAKREIIYPNKGFVK